MSKKRWTIYVYPILMIILFAVFAVFIVQNKKNVKKTEEAKQTELVAAATAGANESATGDEDSDDASNSVFVLNEGLKWSDYIELGDYKGLEVDESIASVTDDDVTTSINDELTTEKEIKDRGIKDGDSVTVDFTGTIDGKEFDGGTESDYALTIGQNDFLEVFDEKLLGVKSGETINITTTLPDDFYNDEVAGKKAKFEIKVTQITEYVVGELTAEYAKEKGYDSVEAYKQFVKSNLTEENKQSGIEETKSTIVSKISENTKLKDYTDEMYTKYDELTKSYIEQQVSMFDGMSVEDYISTFIGDDDAYKEYVESTMKEELIYQAVADKENIGLTRQEYNDGAKEYLSDDITTVEELEDQYGSDEVKEAVYKSKIMQYLYDNAKITQVEATTESNEEE